MRKEKHEKESEIRKAKEKNIYIKWKNRKKKK